MGTESYIPYYGDVTSLNTERTILDLAGAENLKKLTSELMDLLGTSVAIYEKNGDYAYGEFDSAWCRLLDAASRKLCNTNDNQTALNCGKWYCHDVCWNKSAKAAIASKKSTDIDCPGGIKLFAEPIFVGNEVIGVINIGYGNPPTDEKSLKELSEKYSIDFDTLKQKALAYKPRPDSIIKITKKRLKSIAQLIGEIVSRKQTEQALKENEANLQFLNTMVNEALSHKDLNSIYHYISSKLNEILPNTLIVFLTIDSEKEKARLENFYGINNLLFKKLLNVMPFNPVGKTFKLFPDYKILHKTGKLVEFKKGLADFSKNQIPSLAASSLEKVLGIHKIYSIGILRGEKLLANFHLFTFNKTEITNAEFIEAFVKQAGLILQIKQAELELKEANATKDRFISILGHDLQSPFSAVVSLTDLLIGNYDKYNTEQIKEYVEAINKSSKQTFNLLTNLLEWSRSQQNEIPFNPQTTNLHLMIYESYKLMNELAKAKQITIKLNVDEDIEADADREMIKTVIRNLLNNAIKFTPEGGKINISGNKNKKFVEIKISDTGIGLNEPTLNSLFKIDRIKSKPGTNGERGTGFGLLLCKEFIEKHGGKIWAESEIGKGSNFKFTLPVNNENNVVQ